MLSQGGHSLQKPPVVYEYLSGVNEFLARDDVSNMDIPNSLNFIPVSAGYFVIHDEIFHQTKAIDDIFKILEDFFPVRIEMGPLRIFGPSKLRFH
jgi:hypothetical protein